VCKNHEIEKINK